MNVFFLFLNQNICFGYKKEPSQWVGSFEHQKQMLKLIAKNIFTILRWKSLPVLVYITIMNFAYIWYDTGLDKQKILA